MLIHQWDGGTTFTPTANYWTFQAAVHDLHVQTQCYCSNMLVLPKDSFSSELMQTTFYLSYTFCLIGPINRLLFTACKKLQDWWLPSQEVIRYLEAAATRNSIWAICTTWIKIHGVLKVWHHRVRNQRSHKANSNWWGLVDVCLSSPVGKCLKKCRDILSRSQDRPIF